MPERLVKRKTNKVKYYDPDHYIEAIKRDESEFGGYRVYYFIRLYMRKVLEVLAQMELERTSLESGP